MLHTVKLSRACDLAPSTKSPVLIAFAGWVAVDHGCELSSRRRPYQMPKWLRIVSCLLYGRECCTILTSNIRQSLHHLL